MRDQRAFTAYPRSSLRMDHSRSWFLRREFRRAEHILGCDGVLLGYWHLPLLRPELDDAQPAQRLRSADLRLLGTVVEPRTPVSRELLGRGRHRRRLRP
jgi:hypothetical protein